MEKAEFWQNNDEKAVGQNDLDRWEEKYSLKLPALLKELYQKHNGGSVGAMTEDEEIYIDYAFKIFGEDHDSILPIDQSIYLEWIQQSTEMFDEDLIKEVMAETGSKPLGDLKKIAPLSGDGHYLLCLDWNSKGPDKEPEIISIDNEGGCGKLLVAKNFNEMIKNIEHEEEKDYEIDPALEMIHKKQKLHSIIIDLDEKEFFRSLPKIKFKFEVMNMGGMMNEMAKELQDSTKELDIIEKATADWEAGKITEKEYDSIIDELDEDDDEDEDDDDFGGAIGKMKATVADYFKIRFKDSQIENISTLEAIILTKFFVENKIPSSCQSSFPFSLTDLPEIKDKEIDEMLKITAKLVLLQVENSRNMREFYGKNNPKALEQADFSEEALLKSIDSPMIYGYLTGEEEF